MKNRFLLFLIVLFLLSLTSISVNAFQFNGTILDINGNALNNSLINITVVNSSGFSTVGYNTTTTNASGWFNLSVAESNDYFYSLSITWTNSTSGAIEYVGQNLPNFPSQIFTQIAGTTFYLKEAGTVNITAINSTGSRIPFKYQIKDQKLGYSVSSNFNSNVNNTQVVLPRDRNYSIMIYPDQSMPVSFNWNNFSATSSYTVNPISSYNVTTKTLHYQFNTTMNFVRVSGYINYTGVSGWNNFTVVPYLLEPGNMIHVDYGDMPYNMSSVNGETDSYDLTTGFYNITLPSTPAETSSVLLFATAINNSIYYGGFKNITSVGSGINNFNFTQMSILLGSESTIGMEVIGAGNTNIPTAKQTFGLVNATNSSLSNIQAHLEVTLDYSNLGAVEFTWMADISQSQLNPQITVPLLNATGVKEINVFASGGQSEYAPKRVSYTQSQIQSARNITMSSFTPGDVDGASLSGLKIAMYKSNSTCDVPVPSSSCVIGNSENQNFDNDGDRGQGDFNPMKAIMGGGKISFRMGLVSSGIVVHYVNVDMLASGPPDALFDDSTSTDTSSGFSSAMRFGSGGPTMYDYALISIPYSETAGSGLDDSNPVNISIPLFYDDNWNVIWNSSANGTNVANLAGNHSHYSSRQSEWGYLLNQSTCHTNSSSINITDPCYIDTANNRVWLRIPHFSGAGPSVSGSTTAAATTTTPSTSSSSGGGSPAVPKVWDNTYIYDNKDFSQSSPLTRSFGVKEKVRLNLSGESHYVGVLELTSSTALVQVGSEPQNKTMNIGEEAKFEVNGDNFYDVSVKLNSISGDKASLTLSYLHEEFVIEEVDEDPQSFGTNDTVEERSSKLSWIIGLLVVVVLVIILLVYLFSWKKKDHYDYHRR